MFGAIGNLLAPEVTPLRDLQYHWTAFLEYYASKTVQSLKAEPVEKTFLTFHLNKILAILIKEEDNSDGEVLLPCLEHVLYQDILNILVTLCQADTPPGIRPYIFKLFIFLLDKVKYALLCETACHLPISRLTLVCSINKASPSESQEIEFLSLLTNKIVKYPHLVQVFIPSKGSNLKSNMSSRKSSKTSSQINLAQIESLALNVKQALDSMESGHYLSTALLNYIDSSDYCVACTALQNIIKLAGIPSDESAECIIFQSSFLTVIESRLVLLFQSIPEDIDQNRMEELEVNWVQAHKLYSPEYVKDGFHGRTELICFLSFLDFVDNLVTKSHAVIGEEVSRSIARTLMSTLSSIILSNDDKQKVLRGLSYLGVIWNHIKSTVFRDQFVFALFDYSGPSESCSETKSSFEQILDLWDTDVEIKLEAMRILDAMLCSPHQLFIEYLITRYLEDRGYYNQTLTESEANSWSDVEDERSRSREPDPDIRSRDPDTDSTRSRLQDPEQNISKETPRKELKNELISKTFAPSNIHRVVNQWLYLVDDQLRLDEFRGSGYDVYIKDAGRQVEGVLEKCKEFSWEKDVGAARITPVNDDNSSYDSRCESDNGQSFYPGPYLCKLFKELDKMLDQNYEINLQLTSIFSTLVQLPHVNIHEYILNPTLALNPSSQSLYSILRKLVEKGTERCAEINHFPKKLQQARRALLHDGVPTNSLNNGSSSTTDNSEANLLHGIVVLDEFCKELAAISLVKYHIFSGLKG